MTKRLILSIAAALVVVTAAPVSAQQHGEHHANAAYRGPIMSADEQAIADVVETLFDGMRAGDSSMVRSVFHPQIRMVTSFRNREGVPQVSVENDLTGFVTAVGTPHEQVWDEKISNLMIRTDGDFGMAWMEYGFFAGEQFSHCGIDLMELVRTAEGWKIIALADTRRRAGCEQWTTPAN
jgi:hypothetical protein